MPLPVSGNSISMGQANVELNVAAAAEISLNDAVVRALFGQAGDRTLISLSHGFGKSTTMMPATNLTVSDITQTSAKILWGPPLTGSISKYTVFITLRNSNTVLGTATEYLMVQTNPVSFNATLIAYTNYTAHVTVTSPQSITLDATVFFSTSEDLVPDAFIMGTKSGVSPGSLVISEAITVYGLRGVSVQVNISTGAISVDSITSWVAAGTPAIATINNTTNSIQINARITASSGYDGNTTGNVTISGVSSTFSTYTTSPPPPPPPPPTVPPPPTYYRPSPPIMGTATVSGLNVSFPWTAPLNDGGRPIDVYRVDINGIISSTTALPSNNPTIVTGIATVTYYCELYAHNAEGWSDVSNRSNTVTCYTVPGAASNLLFTQTSVNSGNLSFTNPANNGATIDYYYIYKNSEFNQQVNGAGTPLAFTNIANNDIITIKAHNAAGFGGFSTPTTASMLAIPGDITIVVSNSTTTEGGKFDLSYSYSSGGTPSSWEVFSFANYGDYVTGRTARYTGSATSVTLTGFANNTTYYIAAYGVNVAGISYNWSNLLSITPAVIITRTPPGTPYVSDITETTMVVSWAASQGDVSSYMVYRSQHVSDGSWVEVGSTTSTAYTVSSLNPDTYYMFNVKTTFQNGWVLFSPVSDWYVTLHIKGFHFWRESGPSTDYTIRYSTLFKFVVQSKPETYAILRMLYNGHEYFLASIYIGTWGTDFNNTYYPNSAIGQSVWYYTSTALSSGIAYFTVTHWDGSSQTINLTVTN